MSETAFLYTFLLLMTFQLLASVAYIMGLNQMKLAVKKAFRTPEKPRPR
jgi:hypothetical protein